MPMHIALLRGINVGGRKTIAMSELRDLFSALGFAETQSWLQSGNLIFQGDQRPSAKLEQLLEVETEKRLGIQITYLLRTAQELATIIGGNPFPDEAKNDPARLVVHFLKKVPDAKDVQTLRAGITGPEIIKADGKQLYAYYPAGQGQSKLTNAVIERKLGCQGTARNWNTILKLAALAKQ
jgi:uncharacterized protein (DUF1697 family)